MEGLYGGRGRGLDVFPVTPSGRGRGRRVPRAGDGRSDANTAAGEELLQTASAEAEKLMDVRVTEVMDPASFWAQIGEGRRRARIVYVNVVTAKSISTATANCIIGQYVFDVIVCCEVCMLLCIYLYKFLEYQEIIYYAV